MLTKDNKFRVSVTVAALVVVIVRALFPSLVPDAISAGFLLIAFVPWLAPFIKSIELPGGAKAELREIEQKAEQARGAAMSADQKADLALAGGVTPTLGPTRPIAQGHDELKDLAAEYNRIRQTQRSGSARTSAMTSIVSQMISLSANLSPDEINGALKEKDAGKRLVGYAALYAHPKADLLDELVDSVIAIEDRPFGQYWGIQAIGRVIGTIRQEQIGSHTIDTLQSFLERLKPGTDRYYELGRILEDIR
jgi:hypothetical protein